MKRIVADPTKCVACRACELACALEHSESKVLEESISEEHRPQSRISVNAVENFAVPVQCQNCSRHRHTLPVSP